MQITYTHAEILATREIADAIAAHFPLPEPLPDDFIGALHGLPGVTITENEVILAIPEDKFIAVTRVLAGYGDELAAIAHTVLSAAKLFKSATKRLERALHEVFDA